MSTVHEYRASQSRASVDCDECSYADEFLEIKCCRLHRTADYPVSRHFVFAAQPLPPKPWDEG
jgi:hypothetical protein